MLKPCENYGHVMQVPVMSAARRYVFMPYERVVLRLGMHGLDLQAELARTGIPPWFMPNASRRRRVKGWGGYSKRTHRGWIADVATNGDPARASMRTANFDAHRFTSAPLDGRETDVLLYLPEGTQPTEQHCDDLDAMFRAQRPAAGAPLSLTDHDLLRELAMFDRWCAYCGPGKCGRRCTCSCHLPVRRRLQGDAYTQRRIMRTR